jgi:hypothetical protein
MSTPYKNTLRAGDKVWDVLRQRRGLVANNPRESSTGISVILDGNEAPTSIYVGNLRFIPPGNTNVHEDVPPIEGELPPVGQTAAPAVRVTKVAHGDPVELLRSQKAANEAEIKSLEAKFSELRAHNNKIDAALEALSR